MKPADLARIFGVSTVTVAKWADSGKIPSFRTPGGQRRFLSDDVDAFLASRQDDLAAS